MLPSYWIIIIAIVMILVTVLFIKGWSKSIFDAAYEKGKSAGAIEEHKWTEAEIRRMGGAIIYPDGVGKMKVVFPQGTTEREALLFTDHFRHVEDYRSMLSEELLPDAVRDNEVGPMPESVKNRLESRINLMDQDLH